MHPTIHADWLTIVVAVVASTLLGMLWHMALFAKLWMRLTNHTHMPSCSHMIKSTIIGIIATALTAYVMYYSTNIWRPSVWGIGSDHEWYCYGFMSGFYTWLGFFVPVFLGSVAWEGRRWSVFLFNIIYQFVNLQLIGMIIAYMSMMR